MNTIRFTLMLLLTVAINVQAQTGNERSSVKRAATEAETAAATAEPARTQVRTLSAKPAEAGKSASNKISAKPGTVLTLCCGSVDPHEMTGSNCAYMHTGQGCAGFILACPEGSKDTVTENGSGYCKEGG